METYRINTEFLCVFLRDCCLTGVILKRLINKILFNIVSGKKHCHEQAGFKHYLFYPGDIRPDDKLVL